MSDPIRGIVEQVRAIAEQTALRISGISTGTVLSTNSDGSVNVDDGTGGCARVANITNQSTQCGAQVILGVEPAIGNQSSVCPVSITVSSSTKPCPTDDRTDENENEVEAAVGYMFVDNDGYGYDSATGDVVATGQPPFVPDITYGYSYTLAPTENFVGVLDDAGLPLYLSPNYDDVLIGNYGSSPDNSGYQGSNYANTGSVRQGRIARGLGPSTGVLCGMEILNDAVGDHGPNWVVQIRAVADYSIVATNAATYLSGWVTSNFFDDAVTFAPNVAADPDGSFWITIQNGRTDGNDGPNPMFNVSAADGSLITTVQLNTPNHFGSFYVAGPVPI